MTDYQAARKRVEADIAGRHRRGYCSCIIGHSDLRLLLAGPPEPSVEEVARVIKDFVKADATGLAPAVIGHYLFGFKEAAQAVQALYRSKAAPQPDK